ncbi:MAG: nuclear transport factor 2 family protein [Hyphomonadaceae bacterium]
MKILLSIALALTVLVNVVVMLTAMMFSPPVFQGAIVLAGFTFYWLAAIRLHFLRIDLIVSAVVLAALCQLPFLGVFPGDSPTHSNVQMPYVVVFLLSVALSALSARLLSGLRPTLLTPARLRALEETLWRAETRFDRAYCETVFADDFFEFGRSGRIWSRAELIAADPLPIDCVLPFPEFRARMLADRLAQVTYVSIVRNADGGEDVANRSSLWRWEKGRWRICFSQGTLRGPLAGRHEDGEGGDNAGSESGEKDDGQ